jgi:lysophospholipase L1-like esterase
MRALRTAMGARSFVFVVFALLTTSCKPRAGSSSKELSGMSDATSTEKKVGRPCPEHEPCRILPLGDSITDAYNVPGGYRVELFRAARKAGMNVSFVGSQSNGPLMIDGTIFPRAHEGHSGYTIDDAPQARRQGLSALVERAVKQYEPHVVLIMIGTNDVSLDLELSNAPARLSGLVERVASAAPRALLIVAELPPTRNDAQNRRIDAFNSALPALVAHHIAAGRNILLCDTNSAFTRDGDYKTRLLDDDLHPNAAGYERLGRTWYEVLRAAQGG